MLQSMFQRGQGLLLLLQTSMVHLSLSKKLLGFFVGDGNTGEVWHLSLKTSQEAATLLNLKKILFSVYYLPTVNMRLNPL